MNRLRFIQEHYADKPVNNSCGEGYCECEEVNLVNEKRTPKKIKRLDALVFVDWQVSAGSMDKQHKKRKPIHLFAVAMAAFLCANLLVQWNVRTSSEKILSDKRVRAISCGAGNSIDNKAGKDYNDRRQPFNDKNGKSCPHQFNGSGILCCSDTKRKRNNTT